MNQQINVRLPTTLLKNATTYAKKNGFGNIQELIKESLRERVYEEEKLFSLRRRFFEFEKNIKKKKFTRDDLGF